MKIIKSRNIILIIFIFYSISSLIFLIKEKKIFTYKNKSVEYTLEQVFKEGYKLYFYDIEFERVDKVGENDSYFAIFFLSARNEMVSTLSIKNYYIIDKNKKMLVRHAYYHEYRALQNLCLLILHNQKGEIGGGYNKLYGILFDGSWLWEEYINLLIGKDFYHPKNKSRSGSEQLFSGNRQQGLIYPDFIGRDVNNRIIADAKYKPIDNIRSKDYLQVLAYMFRFDAKIGYYLYPESTGKDSEKLRLNQGTKHEQNVSAREDIYVMKCGLEIPRHTSNYQEFVDKIKINEHKFKSNFSNMQS